MAPSPNVLWLRIESLPPHGIIPTTPLRVYFAVSADELEAPTDLEPGVDLWKVRQSQGDYRRTNNLFNSLHEARVGGKRLPEFISYRGLSLWQFLPSYVWPAFYRAVELIEVLKPIINETDPQKILFFPAEDYTDPIWQGILKAVGQYHGIPVKGVRRGSPISFVAMLGGFRQLARCLGASRFIRQVEDVFSTVMIRWMGRHGCGGFDAAGKKLLFATLARNWMEVPGEPGHSYDDQFFHLLGALRRAGWNRFVGLDCPYEPLRKIIPKLRARFRHAENGLCWRSFYSYGWPCLTGLSAGLTVFIRQWLSLKKDLHFSEDFRYRGIALMPALRNELKRAFMTILPDSVNMLKIAGRILELNRPDAIMATYETGPFQRALIIKAAQAGLPTIGLQHGMIFENHYDYMHLGISNLSPDSRPGFFVPRTNCVWGAFWKRSLTDSGHYPQESVVVTGCWRYDRLDAITRNSDAEGLRQRFGIAPGKRVVLVLSGGQDSLGYCEECLKAVAAKPDCVPLIKLHPAENPGQVRELLKRLNYPPETLIEGQIFPALLVSDLVISQWSTVVSEAVLLKKPVILVNFVEAQGGREFVEAKICLSVTRPEDLIGAVDKGLNDDVQSRLTAARDKFIEDFFSGNDGHAAERVVEALETLVKDRRSGHGIEKD